MGKLKLNDVTDYIERNIKAFHQKRIESLESFSLKNVLQQKNPYSFMTEYNFTAEQIIRELVDAHISSNEETIFGDWLEGLAVFVNEKVFKGQKSGITGIDLEFNKDATRYIVAIKSGPNWGNSGQINKMISDFKTAKKTLRTSNSQLHVVAVNGCCYGRDPSPDKGDYFKYCGQSFWNFISDNNELYTEIITPLGYKAKEKNDDFVQSYSQRINVFTEKFLKTFCKNNGAIDWKKLVKFNSASDGNLLK